MAKFLGLVLGVFIAISVASSAEAITISVAEVQNGLAVVQGSKAAKGASITWDGVAVTRASNGGSFSFSATVPQDCVGKLSDGVTAIDVAVLACSPVSTAVAPVARTGQTTSYAPGDDGALRKGVASPNPRFTDNNNGTITDNLTGLIWLKNLGCGTDQPRSWQDALNFVAGINDGTKNCGDISNGGSHKTDWRLPNVRELLSLVDFGPHTIPNEPALPAGHPFLYFDFYSLYWSSTTGYPSSGNPSTDFAWIVNFNPNCPCALAIAQGKTGLNGVAAVRGGS